ncbi:hypothetical protein H0X10_02190 [Candidatus Saccharibacteria bacterium]|nr:hypothetical protein [Candidatus Saccharibacteria bacterium]
MARVRVQIPVDQSAAQQSFPAEHTSQNPRQLMTRKNIITGAIVLVLLAVILLLFSLMNQKKDLEKKVDKLSSGQNSQDDTQKYQDDVSKIVDVPSEITPVVSTPDDAKISQLSKDNSLYKDAKSGDVFLLYTNPDKSLYLVIYRPSIGKVILALSQVSQQSTPTNTTQP